MEIKNFFLILFLSSCSSYKQKSYFEMCNHPETGGTSIPFAGPVANPVSRPECAPDILYSWQKEEKIDWSLFAITPLNQGKYIYTWRTPLATYGYGNVLFRMKLKKDVNFKLIEKYSSEQFRCPMKDQDSTVFVLYKKRVFDPTTIVVSEYLICSVAVLESWSTSTQASFLEAQNEFHYIKEHLNDSPQSYDAFGFGLNRQHITSDTYFMEWDVKKTDWSQNRLVLVLDSLSKTSAPKIYYAKDVDSGPLGHYTTGVESYFKLTSKQLSSLKD